MSRTSSSCIAEGTCMVSNSLMIRLAMSQSRQYELQRFGRSGLVGWSPLGRLSRCLLDGRLKVGLTTEHTEFPIIIQYV